MNAQTVARMTEINQELNDMLTMALTLAFNVLGCTHPQAGAPHEAACDLARRFLDRYRSLMSRWDVVTDEHGNITSVKRLDLDAADQVLALQATVSLLVTWCSHL